MEFTEKFIDENAAELSKKYDLIHGANINLQRISPDLIDGLKPVQRRALYIMYLKDGGKSFRKLATISGDTFGRVHPHSPVAIEDAVVNMAQEWRNSISLVEGEGNFGTCHDSETKVLTRDGWKYFKDLSYDDKLASVDPDTNTMIFENPVNLISYEYEGDLITCQHHSVDFAVTPNHKMLISEYNKKARKFSEFKFIEADDLPNYSRLLNRFEYKNEDSPECIIIEEEKVSNGNILPELIIPMDIWVQFIGIYLADGCMSIETSKKYPYKVINISAVTKDRKKVYFEDIIQAMGLDYSWSKGLKGFQIINKRIWNKLEEYGLFKKKAIDKFVPDFIFDLDSELIKKFLYAFSMGDGSKDMAWGGTSFWTVSPKMAEQLQILSLMSGMPSTWNIREPKETYIRGRKIHSQNKQHQIYQWAGKNQSVDKPRYVKRVNYKGIVYCAEVPTYHTLITMRNRKILVSGNCSGDRAGASRYIKARLSKYSQACFFEDWKDSVIDMELAYDEETMMPLYLPAKYPNILLNGCLGIGYGSSSNVPSFNFREVAEATILLMVNPKARIVLIPDSTTGADIIERDFVSLCERGCGTYTQRCTYEIDAENNIISITSLPELTTANDIREKIADIKENNGLHELVSMDDLSGKEINIQLVLRDNINPYKFMRKLIKEVRGLERSYPVNITVTNDYQSIDYSIKDLLIEWIKWRREQKRSVINNKRATLMAEQRANDVKIFIMNKNNLEDTIKIFRNSHNREEIEARLIEKYKDTEIKMDSLQARALSNMRMIELSIDAYEECVKRAKELEDELNDIEEILNTDNGIDKIIIAELRDGIKRFGTPRRSNVVPEKISVKNEVEGICILQLSSDGMIIRKQGTNAEEEPIPNDSNGFACLVDNDSSFIVVTNNGMHSFIRVTDLPVDTEVPISRYTKKPIEGNIVALLPIDIDNDKCVTLVSRKGIVKKIRILDIGPSKKPLISIDDDDKVIRGVVLNAKSNKDLLVYTKHGMGQRLDPNNLRITSPTAKGLNGFKLNNDDEITGIYAISPEQNQYLLYVTANGKMRLNNISYLPTRNSKHDNMVQLISIGPRDKLVAVVGCNKYDKLTVYYDDEDSEVVDINKLKESTMSEDPKKVTKKNAVSSNVTKVKLV